MRARFGTAGLSESYKAQGHKNMLAVPQYTAAFGLEMFEYQCGHGVRLAQEKGQALAGGGREYNIEYSLHAPYYISMASAEEEKRTNSVEYLLQSAAAVRLLGGKRIVFHPGSYGKDEPEAAFKKVAQTLQVALRALDESGYGDIVLCPETMGKTGQLGTVDEVLRLCQLDERLLPCLDFGHINARGQGAIAGKAEYAAILDKVGNALGAARASVFHAHFSKIEYAAKGERRHLTFADQIFGPDPRPLLELIAERRLAPVLICESDGTQAEDAQTMREYYLECLEKLG